MKRCENCIFYDKSYDDLGGELRDFPLDITNENLAYEDLHYCRIYSPKHIPLEISSDKEECPHRIKGTPGDFHLSHKPER